MQQPLVHLFAHKRQLLAIQHANAARPVDFVAGENIEITVQSLHVVFQMHRALTAMELPPPLGNNTTGQVLRVHHPGGVGDILHSADGGSWLGGSIEEPAQANHEHHEPENSSELAFVAIA